MERVLGVKAEEKKEQPLKEQALDILKFSLGYQVISFIDEGGFSWVYKVEKEGSMYAVKIINKYLYQQADWTEKDFLQALTKEINILKVLEPNKTIIDPPYPIIHTDKFLLFFHKYYNSGNLYTYLNSHLDD